jgi:hypothetical protein
MRRPHLQELRQGPELVLNGPVLRAGRGHHHARDTGRSLQQVGPSDVADEHEVAARQGHEVGGPASRVPDQIAQMFGGVSRGVDGLELDESDGEAVPMCKEPMVVIGVLEPSILPVVPPSFDA